MRTRAPDFAVMPPQRPFLSTTSTLCIPARVRWKARLAPMTPAPMMIASAVCGIAALLPQSPPPNWRGQLAVRSTRTQYLATRNVAHMRQFRQDEFLHSQPHRCTRAGHRDNHRAARHASRGPTHHRRRTDFGIAQRAKKLAKARQFFLKATLHDFIGAIAWGKTRATAQQDRIGVLYLNEVRQQTPDILRLVLDDAIGTDRMPRLCERLLHVLPTRVVVRRAGVAHRDDGTPDTAGSLLSVLLVTHNACPSA